MRGRTAVAVLLISLLIAILFTVEDDVESKTTSDADHESKGPIDSMSLIQSANIRVDWAPSQLKGEEPPATSSHAHQASLDDDMSLFSGARVRAKPKVRPNDWSLAFLSSGQRALVRGQRAVASQFGTMITGYRIAVQNRISQHLASSSTGAIAVVMLITLILCTCMAMGSILAPGKKDSSDDGTPWEEAPLSHHRHSPSHVLNQDVRSWQADAGMQEQRDVTRGSPSSPVLSQYQAAQQRSDESFTRQKYSPIASALSPTPAATLAHLPMPQTSMPSGMGQASEQVAVYSQPLQDQDIPPPLCPRLVMPVCEARFGIPMYELAQLSSEGELHIVGLSGNPLLRAVVRQLGNARTLEIAMPESNSAPRATISPSTQELAGQSQHGCRALEIRGIRGSFYGILEMRGSGACYVLKEGRTVLTIDGDAGTLQLSIKSSLGMQLASVRCASEPFGGLDHVEIRVEPSVDTVLVVSVVLAVLLLSPYLTPTDA